MSVFRVSLRDAGFQRCQFSGFHCVMQVFRGFGLREFHCMIKDFRGVRFRFHCMMKVFRGVRFRIALCEVGFQRCKFSSVPLNDNCFQRCQVSIIVV